MTSEVPWRRALDEVRRHIETKRDHPSNRTETQQKMDRWKTRMNTDPPGAMRETERMLWAIHDQKRPLNTRDPAGIGGFQLYTWISYMHAAKRTEEYLYRWVMEQLDRRFEEKGLVKTSEGWLPIGAVTPSGQNPIEPTDEIVDIEGQSTFIMAYKAVVLPGGGWRLAYPGEVLDGNQAERGQVEAAHHGVDAEREGDHGDVRPDDGDAPGEVGQRALWTDEATGPPGDVGGRVLWEVRRRLDERGGGDRD